MDTILTIISLIYEDNMKKSFFLFLLLLLTQLLFSENVSIQDVLDELNFVRTNPQGYIKILREHINTFDGMQYVDEIGRTIGSHEGTRVVYECIEVLKNTEPMQALSMNENLCSSALWLAKDQAHYDNTGHVGSDGSTIGDRTKRAGFQGDSIGENCAYGYYTARDFVRELLIDDNVPNRGHRINILNKKFDQVGIGLASGHPRYDSVLVMDFGESTKKTNYQLPTSKEILNELNFVRTNPQGYIEILKERLSTFDGMDYVDGVGRKVRSNEGSKAVYECIEVLKNTEPMQALSMNENLCSVALWLAKDSVYSGKLGCVASDGSTSIDRIRKAGFAKSSWSEDSFYGAFTARDFVLAFLINDGLPSRECRDRILDKKFNQVGIGLASGHPAYDSVLIIELVAK